MNKLCYLIIMFFACGVCKAQNLVPNGSFEQYTSCPSYWGQIDSALNWRNPTISILVGGNGGTPDYFNACASYNGVRVPLNGHGYQQARSGVAYAGIELWHMTINWREYIEVELTSPLVLNNCYYFEMFINLGDSSKYSTDAIGVYFSDTALSGINYYTPIPFNPQIDNTFGNIPDTLNWTIVSGNYTAAGGENFLIIGNYQNDANTNLTLVNSNGYPESFVYIDDISLSLCTGTEAQIPEPEIKIYPNPVIDKLNIVTNDNELSQIILYDIISRKLFQQQFTNSISINTKQLAKGIYLYEVRNKNGVVKKGKVVKD